jgi:hypothetical protein
MDNLRPNAILTALLMVLALIAFAAAGRGNIDPAGATAHNFLCAVQLSLIAGPVWLPSLSITSIGVFGRSYWDRSLRASVT